MLVALSFFCAWCFGYAAFRAGLSVKYWTVLGFILGPMAFPLFSTHKRIALRRSLHSHDCYIAA
ncbi:hypothetical protein [Shewanella oneidensis]